MPSPTVRQAAVRSSSALLERYRSVRAASLGLTEPLSPEDLMVQSCPEASPAKWHLAHTSWFFETFVLCDFLAGYQDFHPDFHWLFNSVLQLAWRCAGEIAAGQLFAAAARGYSEISHTRGCGDCPAVRLPAGISSKRRGRAADRHGPGTRATAPGTDRNGYQARTIHESVASGLSRLRAARRWRRNRSACGVVRLRSWFDPSRVVSRFR